MATAMPREVKTALDHICEHHPSVTHVFYSADHRWYFCDDDFEPVAFTGAEDVGKLEDAAHAVHGPAAFSICQPVQE